ncbi:MAG: hypothetical protein HON43_00920 [Alphaproteobacteria bacterium]|jgi:hypothetical protein|nr:hypothetical protein [Alphaproteobacteria bacterium]MBT5389502.1 hypothetical protein [Alphaproteobacteria bacterium]
MSHTNWRIIRLKLDGDPVDGIEVEKRRLILSHTGDLTVALIFLDKILGTCFFIPSNFNTFYSSLVRSRERHHRKSTKANNFSAYYFLDCLIL